MRTYSQKLSLITSSSILICLFLSASAIEHKHHHRHHHHRRHIHQKLFVFGDSYVDTGNNRKALGSSWKEPYGITFPGKPSGRFSDGRVFTDFLARSMGLKTPVAYKWIKYVNENKLKYGMNFAYGGSGVFNTPAPYPNMTTQIDLFENLLNDTVFTTYDVHTSVALVTLAGNDYSAYLARGGSVQGLQSFIPQVANQLLLNIERVYKLGVSKMAVTMLEPLGCSPTNTASNGYLQCNSTYNQAVSFHNLLLQQGIAKINNQTRDGQQHPIIIVDLYSAFLTVLQKTDAITGSRLFKSPLKPCCMGINQNYTCGSVDTNGNKMYTVCKDPKSTFFWDSVHPTQAGWTSVSLTLQPTLQRFRST